MSEHDVTSPRPAQGAGPARGSVAGTGAARAHALDVLRGVAIVWMVLFHFAYDLNHFGWLKPPQRFLVDPFWTWQRVCIVSLFMFCAGAAQAMAFRQGVTWASFWRRWAQVAGCAALVSGATWFVFPGSWIHFGVLHGLALMVLLARLTAGLPLPVLLVLAGVALLLPHGVSHPVFDNPWLQGVGLVTHKPVTEDYAPLLPWMGMVWLGVALGPTVFAMRMGPASRPVLGGVARWLALLGRWPLTIYMLHQPLLWGALLAVSHR